MTEMPMSVLVRSSEDLRLVRCLESIDCNVDCVISMTPFPVMESYLTGHGFRFVLSKRGNPAATTEVGLELCRWSTVLLVDSDCVFEPGAIRRMYSLSAVADIVKPKIDFAYRNLSSWLTKLARDFQYTCCGFVYEPGLVVCRQRVLPLIGGYLFDSHAPFTPDGELDYRLTTLGLKNKLRIVTDAETTIIHDPLSFSRHLHSYWRYGFSEASRMIFLRQNVLFQILLSLPRRHRKAWFGRYPRLTGPTIAVCDVVYLFSLVVHLILLGLKAGFDSRRA